MGNIWVLTTVTRVKYCNIFPLWGIFLLHTCLLTPWKILYLYNLTSFLSLAILAYSLTLTVLKNLKQWTPQHSLLLICVCICVYECAYVCVCMCVCCSLEIMQDHKDFVWHLLLIRYLANIYFFFSFFSYLVSASPGNLTKMKEK